MLIGMVLETLGIGLVVPVLAVITDINASLKYPGIKPLLEYLGNPQPIYLIGGGMLALVLVYAVKVGFLAFLAWKQAKFVFGLDASLSRNLFCGYLHQPYTFHMQRNSAQLIRNVTGEVSQFTTGISAASLLITESLVLVGIATLLLLAEPVGACVVVATLGLSGIAFYRITRGRILRWGVARQYHEAQRLQRLQQGLGGVKDVKVFGRETEFVAEYAHHMSTSSLIGRHLNVLQAMPRLWLELMAVAGLAALVISMLLQHKPLESLVPTLGLFAAAAFRLMPSVSRFLAGLQTLRFNLPVIDALHKERSFLVQGRVREPSVPLPFCTAIELHNVVFTYPESSRLVLSNVSIRVARGSVVGFVGGSGAGKSTIIDLILGLLSPAEGAVLVDGVDIQTNLRGWQDQIGYVPQTIYLTDDSIRRNVAFGVPEAEINDEGVTKAINAAQLTEFVSGLPDELNTLVGERGVRLSGGQRQRIGIARALYHDPQLLVLDEASSALDVETEREVMKSVLALRGSKTVLIVAHRLSTVECCDWIYRMEEGRVIKAGTPADVLDLSGIS
jgi:ABC-type multidrug transport system fused ATPase/permease subunit